MTLNSTQLTRWLEERRWEQVEFALILFLCLVKKFSRFRSDAGENRKGEERKLTTEGRTC